MSLFPGIQSLVTYETEQNETKSRKNRLHSPRWISMCNNPGNKALIVDNILTQNVFSLFFSENKLKYNRKLHIQVVVASLQLLLRVQNYQ